MEHVMTPQRHGVEARSRFVSAVDLFGVYSWVRSADGLQNVGFLQDRHLLQSVRFEPLWESV